MTTLTSAEYYARSPDSRGTWSSERWDEPAWAEVRHRYIGKRTLLELHPEHGTCLLIEGMGLTITD